MMPDSRNMIRTLFHSMQDLGKGARRPPNEPPTEVKRLGVIGAGVMGAGIAYVSAEAGIDVTLIDTTQDERDKGRRDHSAKILDRESRAAAPRRRRRQRSLGAHPSDDRLLRR